MPQKIKSLILTACLLLLSTGVFAGPIVGSITFIGGSGLSTSVSGDGDFSGIPAASSVEPIVYLGDSLVLGWSTSGYSFVADWEKQWDIFVDANQNTGIISGLFTGFGGLSNDTSTVVAKISGMFNVSSSGYSFDITTTAVPEPYTLSLLGIALLVFGGIVVSKKKRKD